MTIGLDSNILCYALNSHYPNMKVKDLLITLSPQELVALNPTVLYETYNRESVKDVIAFVL